MFCVAVVGFGGPTTPLNKNSDVFYIVRGCLCEVWGVFLNDVWAGVVDMFGRFGGNVERCLIV